jgi:hypothetical protein
MKPVVKCASLGIPLCEEVARQVDDLVKSLPKGNEYHYRVKGRARDSTELVKGERASIDMVSTEELDRENEVVLVKGMDLTLFARNPIVPFAHRYDEPPIGKAAWIKKVQGGIRAKTVYSNATQLARTVWDMTREGILSGRSIGFLPTKIRAATHEEISKNATWKSAEIIESGVLLEYSIAPIPVNQASLVEAVAKGRATPEMLTSLGLQVPQDGLAELLAKEFAYWAKRLSPEAIQKKIMQRYGA